MRPFVMFVISKVFRNKIYRTGSALG